jgi:hypothetical protein
MEANVVNTTTAFTAAGFAESVDLQVAYMVSPLRCSTTIWTMSSSNLNNNSEIELLLTRLLAPPDVFYQDRWSCVSLPSLPHQL